MDLRILPKEAPPRRKRHVSRNDSRLSECKAGDHLQLHAIRVDATQRKHLHRCGVIEGRVVQVIHSDHKGTLVLELDGRTLILGRRETYHMVGRLVEIH